MTNRKVYLFSIFSWLFISLWLTKNFYLLGGYPAGTDTLGWIARVKFYTNYGLTSWIPASYGQPMIFNLEIALVALNLVMRNSVLLIELLIGVSIFLAGISMFLLVMRLISNPVASAISGMVYVFNQYFISKIAVGHLPFVLGYAVAPLVFLALTLVIEKASLRRISILSGLLAFIFLFTRMDILFYYFPFLVLYSIAAVFRLKHGDLSKSVLKILKVWGVTMLLFFGLISVSLLPIAMGSVPSTFQPNIFPIEHLERHSLGIFESTLGVARELGTLFWLGGIHWEFHPFLPLYQYRIVMSFVPILAFAALLLRRDQLTIFLGIGSLISIFLAKGPHFPFGEIYTFLVDAVPFFGKISAPNRWLMLVYFFYSMMVGITIKEFFNKVRVSNFVHTLFTKRMVSLIVTSSVVILLISSSVISVYPFAAQGIQVWSPPVAVAELYLQLSTDKDEFRVVTVPYYQEYMRTGVWFKNRDWVEHDIGFESGMYHNRPVVGRGEFERGLSNDFVTYTLELVKERNTKSLAKLLGLFNVKYVVVNNYPPYEPILRNPKDPYYQQKFFLSQEGLRPVYAGEGGTVLLNENWVPRIFATQNYAVVIGGREALLILSEIDHKILKNNALLFARQLRESINNDLFLDFLEKSELIIFVNSDFKDLVMLLSENQAKVIALSDFGFPSMNPQAYWITSDETILNGLNAETVLKTSGQRQLTIPFMIDEDGLYDIWIRVLEGPERATLNIFLDGHQIAALSPMMHSNSFRWIKLASINLTKGSHSFLLQNLPGDSGNINILDRILVVKPYVINESSKQLEETLLKHQDRIIYLYSSNYLQLVRDEIGTSWRFDKHMVSITPIDNIRASLFVINDGGGDFLFLKKNDRVQTIQLTSTSTLTTTYDRWRVIEPEVVNIAKVLDDDEFIPDYLNISVSPVLRGFYTLTELRFEESKNWSGIEQISFWARSTGNLTSFSFVVHFGESLDNWVRFDLKDIPNYWTKLNLDLSSSSAKEGMVRWDRVSLIRIVAPKETFGELYISEIIGRCKFFTPVQFDIADLDNSSEIVLTSDGKPNFILVIHNLDNFPAGMVKDPIPDNVRFERISPSKYKVKVSINTPHLLVFSEAHHPLWVLRMDNSIIKSLPAYSFVNSFYVEDGEYEGYIEYLGDTYNFYGALISLSTIALLTCTFTVTRTLKEKWSIFFMSFKRRRILK